MIRKILTGEYLKPVGAMGDGEREAYQKRVGAWLASDGERLLTMTDRPMARTQSLMSISVRWSREDCEAVHEGARLMTALVEVADTWLPSQLWTKSAWRAVRHITESLSLTLPEREGNPDAAGVTTRGTGRTSDTAKKMAEGSIQRPLFSGVRKVGDAPMRPAKAATPAGKPQGSLAEKASTPIPTREGSGERLVPVRPKHIDQYVHLLPKATQERAAMVKGLLRDLDVARENARRLVEAGEHGDKIAQWANAATQLDEKAGKIYKELDAEWEKLVADGRVAADAFGNAYVTAPHTVQDNEGEDTREPLTSEQKHRRRELRKWLIDLRRGGEGKAREKRIEQWKTNWKEYLTLEPLEAALKDEKVVQAAAHFGIDINS